MIADSERYLRHQAVAGLSQNRLSNSRVLVLGAGATGNETIKNLTLLGVGFVDVFDFDAIEGHNLTRSVLFRESDVDASKVAVACRRASELDPNVTLTAFHGDLFETLTFARVRLADVVIIALDNIEARIRTNLLCRLAGVPLVNTAIDARNVAVAWFPFSQDSVVACFECNLSESVYAGIAKKASCGGLRKQMRADGLIPSTIITSSMAAAMAVNYCVQSLHGERPAASRQWSLDVATGQVRVYDLPIFRNCHGCAGLASATHAHTFESLEIERGEAVDGVPIPQDLDVETLDALITVISCENCGASEHSSQVIGQPLRMFTTELQVCVRCSLSTRTVQSTKIVDSAQLVNWSHQSRPNNLLALIRGTTENHVFY